MFKTQFHILGVKIRCKCLEIPIPPNPQVVNISKDGNGINSPRKTVAQGVQPQAHSGRRNFRYSPRKKELKSYSITIYHYSRPRFGFYFYMYVKYL